MSEISQDMLLQAVVAVMFLLFQFVALLTISWWLYCSLLCIMSIWVHVFGIVAAMYSLVQVRRKSLGDYEVFMVY